MSDATAVATAIPREINLGLQKPVATPAYTRRFKSNAGTPTVTAGSQVTITLDTAQPGSFIDTLSSYLSFKLDIVNDSLTSGYNVAFSGCGAHALFRAMRIYVQGVPIEEITEYNALVEWLHDLTGIPDYCDRSAKSRYFANTMMDDQSIYIPPATQNNGATTPTVRTLNIQLPLISGVLGTMAEKMFPSMLVAPGNCYIQLDMASAAHAFRVVEVNVAALGVGTAPANIAAGGQIQLNEDLQASDCTLPVRAVNQNVTTSLVTTGFADAVYGLDAATTLEDGPYDAPYYRAASGTAPAESGILTTEERIGGGMFWNGAVGTTYATGGSLVVSNSINENLAGSLLPVTDISTRINEATTDISRVFLGAGMDATAGGIAGQNSQRCTPSAGISISYQLRDLEYVGKQVVVGDDVARAIIERAASGDISIHTQSYRQYPATISMTTRWQYRVDPAYAQLVADSPIPIKDGAPLCNMFQRYNQPGGQSIIIPAKISSANAMYHIFRNGAGMDDFRFDSLRRMTIGMTDNPSAPMQVQAQIRIGNELIPQSPIASASEALEELLKAHHVGGYYGTCEKMGSIVASSQQYAWPQLASYMLRRGAGATNVLDGGADYIAVGRQTVIDGDASAAGATGGVIYPRNDFNSQILTPPGSSVSFKFPTFASYNLAATGTAWNVPLQAGTIATTGITTGASAKSFYDRSRKGKQLHIVRKFAAASGAGNPVTFAAVGSAVYPESQEEYTFRSRKWKDAVKKAFFGYADERSDHQVTDPTKPNFMNPYKQHAGRYSTFMLGFDLDTFSHNSETVRSGHYLGNNTVSLNLSNMEIIDNSPLNQPLCNNVRIDTFVLHDLRLSFQAGGIVQAFY